MHMETKNRSTCALDSSLLLAGNFSIFSHVGLADFDADGYTDILLADTLSSTPRWYRNALPQNSTVQVVPPLSARPPTSDAGAPHSNDSLCFAFEAFSLDPAGRKPAQTAVLSLPAWGPYSRKHLLGVGAEPSLARALKAPGFSKPAAAADVGLRVYTSLVVPPGLAANVTFSAQSDRPVQLVLDGRTFAFRGGSAGLQTPSAELALPAGRHSLVVLTWANASLELTTSPPHLVAGALAGGPACPADLFYCHERERAPTGQGRALRSQRLSSARPGRYLSLSNWREAVCVVDNGPAARLSSALRAALALSHRGVASLSAVSGFAYELEGQTLSLSGPRLSLLSRGTTWGSEVALATGGCAGGACLSLRGPPERKRCSEDRYDDRTDEGEPLADFAVVGSFRAEGGGAGQGRQLAFLHASNSYVKLSGMVVTGFSASAVRAVESILLVDQASFSGNEDRSNETLQAASAGVSVTQEVGRGAAVFAEDSCVLLRKSSLSANWASDSGGAVYVEGTFLLVRGCAFYNNTASRAGALAINRATDQCLVDDSIFQVRALGSISLRALSSLFVYLLSFFPPSLFSALFTPWLPSFLSSACPYQDNRGTTSGAASFQGASVKMTNVSFVGNGDPPGDTLSGAGGAIMVDQGSSISVTDGVFHDNRAKIGGAVEVKQGGSFFLTNVNATGNGGTGCVMGGFLRASGASEINVQSSTIEGNTAWAGGGLYFDFTNLVFLKKNHFEGNSAYYPLGRVSTSRMHTIFPIVVYISVDHERYKPTFSPKCVHAGL